MNRILDTLTDDELALLNVVFDAAIQERDEMATFVAEDCSAGAVKAKQEANTLRAIKKRVNAPRKKV